MRSPYNREYQGTNGIWGQKSRIVRTLSDNKDQPTLAQMHRDFERLGGFCALQSGMVS